MRAQAGQSTVEYGALLLIALVLFAVAALAATGTGIADAVAAQMRRALCLATGRGCESLALAPCVTDSRSTLREASLRIAFVRLSGSTRRAARAALGRQRRPDSLLARGRGTAVRVSVAARDRRLRSSADRSAGRSRASLARGRVWRLKSDAEADALLRSLGAETARRNPRAGGSLALRLRDIPRPRRPDETFGEDGLAATLCAPSSGRFGIELGAQDLAGSRADGASGTRTLTLRRRNDLTASVAVLGAGVVGRGRHEERYGLRVDAAGRPLELVAVELLGLRRRRAAAGARCARRSAARSCRRVTAA